MIGELSRQDVEQITGYSRSTIERAVTQFRESKGRRGLRFVQRVENGRRRFRKADVEAWATGQNP